MSAVEDLLEEDLEIILHDFKNFDEFLEDTGCSGEIYSRTNLVVDSKIMIISRQNSLGRLR